MTDRETGDAVVAEIRARLEKESGLIQWSELVRHFARGVVLKVNTGITLVDAAICLARDDKQQLEIWLTAGQVARASDDDARDWTRREPEFWCVIAAPWVLVQEREPTGPLN